MLVKDIGMLYKHYTSENNFIVRRMIGTTIHNLKNELAEYHRTLGILKQIDNEEWLLSKNMDMLDKNIVVLKKKIKYKQMQINLAKLIFDNWRYISALEAACIIYSKIYDTKDNPFIKENLLNLIKKHFKFIFINCNDTHLREIPKDIITLNKYYNKTYYKKYRRK